MRGYFEITRALGVQSNNKKFEDWALLPNMKCYLWNLYKFDKSWYNHQASRELPKDAKAKEIDWVGDASTGFGLGIVT